MIRAVLLAALTAAGGAAAQPFVQIDAGLRLELDPAGRLAALAVDWRYGRADSRSILTERGFPEGDAVTPADLDRLAQTGIDWAEVPGDLEIRQNGAELLLGPIEDPRAGYEDGRITLSHRRRLLQPVAADIPVEIRVFDPTFYIAYSLDDIAPLPEASRCRVTRIDADLKRAGEMLGQAMETGESEGLGRAFADTVRLDCG